MTRSGGENSLDNCDIIGGVEVIILSQGFTK